MTGSSGRTGRPLCPDEPTSIGDYRLLAMLGEGGMGRVYLARAPTGRRVAIKLIRPDVARSERFRRRFRAEVARARQVPPFCTAEVLDADPDHDPPYLVVEYVEGPDLATVIRENGPLSPANLHALAIGVATALTAIHAAGVIHRDLKAANVLLAPGSPKVIDFGLAREVDCAARHTATGELVGTVAYMAPERLEPNGQEPTPAVDIFSWGAVVTLAGTGRVPFTGECLPALAYQIMTAPPDLAGLPDGLRDLVQRALAKDPTARPSARELLDQLLTTGPGTDRVNLLRAGSQQARVQPTEPAGTTQALRTGATRPRRGRRLVATLAVGALLSVGGVAGAKHLLPYLRPAGGGVATPVETTSPSPDPSPTPSPSPTPTLSPAPSLIPPDTQLIVRDPLTAPGQWRNFTDPTTQTTCTFADGFVVTTGVPSFRCPGPRDSLADFAVFVEVTLTEPGSCATIWFRFSVSGGGYALRVCEDAYYLVTHGTPEPHRVRDLRRFPLDSPVAGPTRVGIAADGESFRFYRDQEEVGNWSDRTFTSGQVWLGILQMDPAVRPPYQVSFADVEVWGNGT